jgi:hypothetical protein
MPPPPAAGGRKKALLIGINYRGTQAELNGCMNDEIHEALAAVPIPFPESSIVLLAEDGPADLRPTKRNIMRWVQWLVGEPGKKRKGKGKKNKEK